jgi:chorismate mutase
MTTAAMTERRDRISAIDDEIIRLVAERVQIAREIGRLKREAGVPTLDPGREAAVVRRAVERARRQGLADEPVRDIAWILVRLCRSAQLEEQP